MSQHECVFEHVHSMTVTCSTLLCYLDAELQLVRYSILEDLPLVKKRYENKFRPKSDQWVLFNAHYSSILKVMRSLKKDQLNSVAEALLGHHLIMCAEKRRLDSISHLYMQSGEIMKICNNLIKRATIPGQRLQKFISILSLFHHFEEMSHIMIGI